MSTARYVVAVLLVAGLPPGVVWWFAVHPFVDFWRRLGVRTTMWTMGITMLAAVTAIFLVRDAVLGRDLGTSWPRVGLAVVLAAAAAVIALKRKRHLTNRILAGVPEIAGRAESTLLTQGPYAVIRHPRYVEVLLATFAYAFFANYVGVYAVALATIPVLHLVVILEERELADRFGSEWVEYSSRVPRYVPSRFTASKSISTTSRT